MSAIRPTTAAPTSTRVTTEHPHVATAHTVTGVDPFELPDWLGTAEVGWSATSSIHDVHLVSGELSGSGEQTACDLLAADVAFPQPVLDERWRRSAHQEWTHHQVLLVEYDGRLTLLVPGTGFTADLVLEGFARLAKAIGVSPTQFVASLRL